MKNLEKEEQIQGLVLLVFEKAKNESKKTKAYGLSKYLEPIIGIDSRSLTRYYNGYVLNRENEKKVPYDYNLDLLSEYLGFKDFRAFELKNECEEDKILLLKEKNIIERKLEKIKKMGLLASLGLSIIATIFILKYYKKNCIIWVDDHYEKIRCSGLDNEKELDYALLEKFKKKYVCKDSIFFKDGEPIIHYIRHKGEIEFFTYAGEHPIYKGIYTDPITRTIIESRVKPCDSIN